MGRNTIVLAAVLVAGPTAVPQMATGQSQAKKIISGWVKDSKGAPLPYVNVFLQDTIDGDVSDSTGYFEILTERSGMQILIASMIGYEQNRKEIEITGPKTEPLTIVLRERAIAMPEATITASSFSSGDEKGVTLNRMDVVTTPGAAADIFLAIKSFPGLAHIDEGSGLFVRGGDVSETVTILDQATVVHPYRYESPTGGTFGTITPFLVSGTFFSSGGFSAKYGNALSGVLAMESLDKPPKSEYTVNVGLASTSARLAVPINQKLGFRFSGNRSSTGLMFRVNGRFSEFTKHPGGTDGNFSLNYEYSKTGWLKLFGFAAKTEIGVKVDQPSFDGIFVSEETNQLYNLQWSQLLDKSWLIQTSLSLNSYRTERNFGVLDLNQSDHTYKFRLDTEKEFGPKFKANLGSEGEVTRNRFAAVFPDGDVLDPNAPSLSIDEHYHAVRIGAYGEAELQLARAFFLKSGFRVDHNDLADELVIDPRASLFYQISGTGNLRVSWGIYHQFAEPLLYAPVYGNANLKSQTSTHYIVGYEKQLSDGQARVELYYKDYDRLVIENEELEFANSGHGYARGLDLFFKRGVLFQDKLNGWVSYSLLQSKRLQTRGTRAGQVEELAPSSFDITHNLTLVGKLTIGSRWSAGLTFRYATGRPFTPVVDAERDPQFNFYTPFEGSVNSERLPNYHRLDASLSYFWPFQNDYAIFYFALSNVLNRKNVLAYDYSIDYSERNPRTTNFSRFIYFGATFTLR